MARAFLMIRGEPQYRREAFEAGLRQVGFEIHGAPRDSPRPTDLLVTWNRYARWHQMASAFERAGARVLCAENGVLGRDLAGDHWYSIAFSNVAKDGGRFNEGEEDRFEGMPVELCEWRKPDSGFILILAQRGIGAPATASPPGWHLRIANALRRFPIKLREHPGEKPPRTALEEDFAGARCVISWSSGAAIRAIAWGLPVFHGLKEWVAAEVSTLVRPETVPEQVMHPPPYPDRSRTFQRLGWTSWRTREIADGIPFRALGL